MNANTWTFALALQSADGAPLGQFPVEPDFEPACESVRFAAMREGDLFHAPSSDFKADPVWDETKGQPYLAAVRVSHGARSCEIPRRYFKKAARKASAALVEQGRLKDGEVFHYSALAFSTGESRPAKRAAFSVEELPPPLNIGAEDLAALSRRATPVGESAAEDVRVFIPQNVIAELEEQTRAAGEIETGSILIGHLRRDPATAELAVVITAQTPAQESRGESLKVTFTAATWEAARAALDLRRAGEIMLGTAHSHPAKFWCAKCPPERQRACSLGQPFVSDDDQLLHRATFVRGFCVALVFAHNIDGIRHALFGWRRGLLEERAYHLLDARPAAPAPISNATSNPDTHATPCPQDS